MKFSTKLIGNLVTVIALGCSIAALARSKEPSPAADNVAVIIGDAGERYPLVGAGGIKVRGGHHGMFMSNMKSSSIEIDGSEIGAQFLPVPTTGDFSAAGGHVYFASVNCTCSFEAASNSPGKEIVVINCGENSNALSVNYKPNTGERIVFAGRPDPATNTVSGQVDRFISNGQNWYHE